MQPVGQPPGYRRRVVPAEFEHRPFGQPWERQSARSAVGRYAEPATAGLRKAAGAYDVAHRRRTVPRHVARQEVGVLLRRPGQEGRCHRVGVLVAKNAAVTSQPVEDDRPALLCESPAIRDDLRVHRAPVVVPYRPAVAPPPDPLDVEQRAAAVAGDEQSAARARRARVGGVPQTARDGSHLAVLRRGRVAGRERPGAPAGVLAAPHAPGDAGARELGAIGADDDGRAPPVRGARMRERVARVQPQELPRDDARAF